VPAVEAAEGCQGPLASVGHVACVCVVAEGLQVPGAELVVGVLGVADALLELLHPPAVRLQVLDVLVLHRLDLPHGASVPQQGGDEELGKRVKGRAEELGGDFELVVCVLRRGVGVGVPPVLREESGILVLIRVLLGPHEQHVLQKVGEAGQVLGVAEVPNGHVHRGRDAVRCGVRDGEDLKAVWEHKKAVGASV